MKARHAMCCGRCQAGATALWLAVLAGGCGPGASFAAPVTLAEAFERLNFEQDRYHRFFTVFDDRDSGAENFHPSGCSGDFQPLTRTELAAVIDTGFAGEGCGGTTCVRLTYPPSLPAGQGWAGISWDFPKQTPQDAGLDLRRYQTAGEPVELRFRAKAGQLGEATFAFSCLDAGGKTVDTTRRLTVWPEWRDYVLDVSHLPLRDVVSGMAVFTQAPKDGAAKTLYLDEARIVFGKTGTSRRLNEPHFTRSYIPEKPGEPDRSFRNSCFSYDNALMILAYCARGGKDDLRRAGIIADAFVNVQKADSFQDGRIRNGYACGELFSPMPAAGGRPAPRLPGFWCDASQTWIQDSYCAGTDSGNMAWVGLALVEMCDKTGAGRRSPYFPAARLICDWIFSHARSTTAQGGYCGGVDLVPPGAQAPDGQAWARWKSCEHNIDIDVLFRRFAALSEEPVWLERAEHARGFVLKMRDPVEKILRTGTLPDDAVNPKVRPLDVNPWALMAFEDAQTFGPAVDAIAARNGVVVTVGGAEAAGHDFNNDHDGIWWEGVAQMVLAHRMLGQPKPAGRALASLRKFGGSSSSPGALVAALLDPAAPGAAADVPVEAKPACPPPKPPGEEAPADKERGLTTGFDRPDGSPWVYWARPHAGGATCWYIFAELNWNPYWGKRLPP